jgi:tRNA A-37 threonylcarbamoyl transferase component Bud32
MEEFEFFFFFSTVVIQDLKKRVDERELMERIELLSLFFQMCMLFFLHSLGILALCSVRDIHKYGYVHNDLKIDNFVLDKTESFSLFFINTSLFFIQILHFHYGVR